MKVLLLGIAAQYLYITIWRELQNQGIMKTDGTVLFYSIGLSRMELIIRFKEQVCYYVKLDLKNKYLEDGFNIWKKRINITVENMSIMIDL